MSTEKTAKTAKEKLLARVAAMQKQINAASEDDLKGWAAKLDSEGCGAKLKQEADAATAAERETAEESTGVDTAAAAGGQNARANANWPMSAKLKMARKLASLAGREANTVRRMLALAGEMQADDAEVDDETVEARVSRKLASMAAKRSRSAAAMMKMARKTIKAKDIKAEDECDDADAGKPFESRDSKIAARLVAIAKNLIGEDEAVTESEDVAPTTAAEDVPAQDDAGKEIAAALVELAKSLTDEK